MILDSCCGLTILWRQLLGQRYSSFAGRLTNTQLDQFYILYVKACTPVDPNSPYHQTLLSQYWSLAFPDQPAPPIPADEWVLLGFQSENPWTDFRGGGVLALESIVEVATNYNNNFRDLVSDTIGHTQHKSYASPINWNEIDKRSGSAAQAGPRSTKKKDVTNSPTYYPYTAAFINVEAAMLTYIRIGTQLRSTLSILDHSMSLKISRGVNTADIDSISGQPLLKGYWRPDTLAECKDNPAKTPQRHGLPKAPSGCKEAPRRVFKKIASQLHEHVPYSTTLNPAYSDLFSIACLELHKEWLALCKRQGNIMEFPQILSRTLDAVSHFYLEHPKNEYHSDSSTSIGFNADHTDYHDPRVTPILQ